MSTVQTHVYCTDADVILPIYSTYLLLRRQVSAMSSESHEAIPVRFHQASRSGVLSDALRYLPKAKCVQDVHFFNGCHTNGSS